MTFRAFLMGWLMLLLIGLGQSGALAQPCTSRTTAEHDIATWRMLRVYYDNDLFAGTNRYYTSGLRIEYIAPSCFYFLTSRLLFRWGLRSRTYYGFSVSHQLYTPESLTRPYQDGGDRPFAGTLSVSHFMISNLRDERMRFLTEVQLGLIGPLAGGRSLAQGDSLWEDQVKLDLLLGYRARLEKGLFEPNVFDLSAYGEAQLNTGLTYAEAGAVIRLGRLNPPFYELDFSLRSSRAGREIHDWQLFVFAQGAARLVGYDATLQGGLLNRSSPYTLAGSDLRRFVPRGSVGFTFIYRFLGLGYEHVFQGPQFANASAHSYGQVKLLLSF
jgi:hypothetical protein